MDNIIYPNHRYRQKVRSRNARKNFKPFLEQEDKTKILNRILIVLILCVSAYLIFFFTYHVYVKPNRVVENVEIIFYDKLDIDQKDILAVTGLDHRTLYADVREDAIANAIINSFPYVKEVEVLKTKGSSLQLKIAGRRPVCVSLFNTDSVSVPLAIDSEGRIFELGTAVKEFDLPVISGIKIPSLELNAQIPAVYIPVLEDLEQLQKHRLIVYNRVSEIAVDEKNGKGYDLYVYFRMYDLPVLMGSRMVLTEMEAAVQVLDLLQSSGLAESYSLLDFRSGKPILKKK